MTENTQRDKKVLRLSIVAAATAITYALGLYAITANHFSDSGFLLISFLFGVPAASAAIIQLVVDPKVEKSFFETANIAAGTISAMLLLAGLVLKEGFFCIILTLPIFFIVILLSVAIMRFVLKRTNNRLYSAPVILFPLLFMPVENQIVFPDQFETVSTLITIDATPEQIWPHLLSVPNIQEDEMGWTFTQDIIGIPKPTSAKLIGSDIGSVRKAKWGKDIHFDEEIIAWERQRKIEWKFRFFEDSIPDYIESHISPDSKYLTLDRGAYSLRQVSPTSTEIQLSTHYRVRSPLNAYCAWWGDILIGDFHKNVLKVIKGRSEQSTTKI